MENRNLKQSINKASKGLYMAFPMVWGIVLLTSLITVVIPKPFYLTVFNKSSFLDSLIGSLVGSISAGTPITSYIFGGEMLNQGIGLMAVTAFLVSWVTVGLVQFPAEAAILGKNFAFTRNMTAFLFSIVVAIMTVLFFNVVI